MGGGRKEGTNERLCVYFVFMGAHSGNNAVLLIIINEFVRLHGGKGRRPQDQEEDQKEWIWMRMN